MGCHCAGQTIRLPHGNGGGGAGNPGSLLNGLEWVAFVQDELSACLMVTGEEVLETLGPLVSCVGCRYQIIFFFSKICITFLTKQQLLILLKILNILPGLYFFVLGMVFLNINAGVAFVGKSSVFERSHRDS
jgi:hypothetical protein